MKAADLLDKNHPLRKLFVFFLDGKEPTKRQARKFMQFMQKCPQYTQEQEA